MSILNKIKHKKTLVGIMGLGYVGLSNAILINSKKFKVIGFDINSEKIKKLTNNTSYIEDIRSIDLKNYNKRSIFTNDLNLLKDCDIIIISVPTPLTKNSKPDLGFIKSA